MDQATFDRSFGRARYFIINWNSLIEANEIALIRQLLKVSTPSLQDVNQNITTASPELFKLFLPFYDKKDLSKLGVKLARANRWDLVLEIATRKEARKTA